jgi:predicted transglutaminase-like cysteine proteinase
MEEYALLVCLTCVFTELKTTIQNGLGIPTLIQSVNQSVNQAIKKMPDKLVYSQPYGCIVSN